MESPRGAMIVAALFFGALPLRRAAVLQVHPGGTDIDACVSAPCASLRYAIERAFAGDTIQLTPGTYDGPGNRNLDVAVQDLSIIGIGGSESTVLDLERSGVGFRFGAEAGAPRVQGLTIINGRCSAASAPLLKRGAAFQLEESNATITDVAIRAMDCTGTADDAGLFTGGAFFLENSSALIERVVVEDCEAQRGGGLAARGADSSIVRDASFVRTKAVERGGAIIAEGDSGTAFHQVRFSNFSSGSGGALYEDGTAHCFFKECSFEHGDAEQGSVGHHTAHSRGRFEDCTFSRNNAVAATHYIHRWAKPAFTNCTFVNNTASERGGCIVSFYAGRDGPMYIDGCSFINNSAGFAGAISLVFIVKDSVLFRDCLFEGNVATHADGGAIQVQIQEIEDSNTHDNAAIFPAAVPTFLFRTRFIRNIAQDSGGAVQIWSFGIQQVEPIVVENCTFDENVAGQDGGAIAALGAAPLCLYGSSFTGNVAEVSGGAVAIKNQLVVSPSQVILRSTDFVGNTARAQGGALSCVQRKGASTSLQCEDCSFRQNLADGNGGAMAIDCSGLSVTRGVFSENRASHGHGGALALGAFIRCPGPSFFRDVTFISNQADGVGGLVYFDHLKPRCRLPLLPDGSIDTSDNSTWSWPGGVPLLAKNTASAGPLQATLPATMSFKCGIGGDLSAFTECRTNLDGAATGAAVTYEAAAPGMELDINAVLFDDFGQSLSGATEGNEPFVRLEVVKSDRSSPVSIGGALQQWNFLSHRLRLHEIKVQGLNGEAFSKKNFTEFVVFRVPPELTGYSHIRPLSVELRFDGQCPAGHSVPGLNGAKAQTVLANGTYGCEACDRGSYAPEGVLFCDLCPQGTYGNGDGLDSCEKCPAGSRCPQGVAIPIPCEPGQFSEVFASGECSRCIPGTYQSHPKSTGCEQCSSDRTTGGPGAVSLRECRCRAGSFSRSRTDRCEPCPEGMRCDFGADLSNFLSDVTQETLLKDYGMSSVAMSQALSEGQIAELRTIPQLMPGFYSSADDPLNVFRCAAPDACPGGPPGTCAQGSEGGFLCMTCGQGKYFSQGVCLECQAYHWVAVFVVAVATCVVLFIIARAAVVATGKQSPYFVLMYMIIGQLVSFLQLTSAVAKLPVNWTNPWTSFSHILRSVNLRSDMVQLECLNIQGNVSVYAMRVMFPCIVVLTFCAMWFVVRLLRPQCVSFVGLANALGQLCVSLCVAFTLLALVPFHCLPHPNGRRSVEEYPLVLYGEGGEHTSMILFGVIALVIYPLLTISVVLNAVLRYPRAIVSSNMAFVDYFRFVFFRFKPERFWFGAVLVFRNMLLPLLPMTIPTENADITSALMQLILWASLLSTVMYMPWRFPQANYMEIFLLIMLVTTMSIGSMAIYPGVVLSHTLCNIAFVCSISGLGVSFAFALRQAFSAARSEKSYAVFLSHHKGSGACAARLLKYMLSKDIQRPIFYDCDDLVDLEDLFTAVKQSSWVLVLLSGETLCRPWCAGEIVTAHTYGIRMLPLRMIAHVDKWCTCTREEQNELVAEQFGVLSAHGITSDAVFEAYEALLERKAVALSFDVGSAALLSVVRSVSQKIHTACPMLQRSREVSRDVHKLSRQTTLKWLEIAAGFGTRGSPKISPMPEIADDTESCASANKAAGGPTPQFHKALVMCDANNAEGAASAHLIRFMMQEMLQTDVGVDLDMNFEKFSEVVASDGLRAVLCVVSPRTTLTSVMQLTRLGCLFKLRPRAEALPVVVGEGFVFPDHAYYAALEGGTSAISAALAAELPATMVAKDVADGLRQLFKGIAKTLNIATASQDDLAVGMSSLSTRLKTMCQLSNV